MSGFAMDGWMDGWVDGRHRQESIEREETKETKKGDALTQMRKGMVCYRLVKEPG